MVKTTAFRLRLSLRTLLLLMTTAAVLCTWLSYELAKIRTKSHVIQVIASNRGSVRTAICNFEGFYRWLGDEMPGEVVDVHIHEGDVEAQFDALAESPQLESLHLIWQAPRPHLIVPTLANLKEFELTGPATAERLRNLSRSPRLESLTIRYGEIDSAVLKNLATCQRLRIVSFKGTPLQDDFLKPLTAFPNLVSLDLSSTGVTDEGLQHVAQIASLEYLWLNGLDVTDAGIAALKKLKGLKGLHLRHCRNLTDAGAKHLPAIGRLEMLSMGPAITSDVTPVFESMPGLNHLVLWNVTINKEAIAAMQTRRPDMQVFLATDPFFSADQPSSAD
ncbi:hypothetical protein [Anatilimnocola floriformis]|uniref:hypothetical protein n=1 Tax=Anatilimnocola floriformis TaxID=2948575 RepID=UPI0020C2713A|nr:hypothetical protein [Anatilimnocola floriformis]